MGSSNCKNIANLLFWLVVGTFVSNAQDDKVFVARTDIKWRFSIGDNPTWSSSGHDDSSWETQFLPGTWEDQGFNGYDGYAWYRTTVMIGKEAKAHDLFLSLGYVDDVDEVYFNGKLIGFSGKFPPAYATPLEAKRRYPIPDKLINFQAKNTIAVRIYNHQLAGGIISGELGIFYYKIPKPDISLQGLWLFKTGDSKSWKAKTIKENSWKKLSVPGNWENQGFKGYKGTVWYRKDYTLTVEETQFRYALVLGNLPDNARVYLNNKELTATPKLGVSKLPDEFKNYKQFYVPDSIHKPNERNQIAIRISPTKTKLFDGPVGLIRISE